MKDTVNPMDNSHMEKWKCPKCETSIWIVKKSKTVQCRTCQINNAWKRRNKE